MRHKVIRKTVRYIALGLVSIIILAIFFTNRSFISKEFFTSEIDGSMIYSLFFGIISGYRNLFYLPDYFPNAPIPTDYIFFERLGAYFLWFVCFGISIFLSWKYRFRTSYVVLISVNVIVKVLKATVKALVNVLKNIHKKI